MKNRIKPVFLLLLFLLFCAQIFYSFPVKIQLSGQKEKLDKFFLKNEVTVDDTSFSKETSTPVVGTVEAGVELIAQKLETSPEPERYC